MKSFKSEQGIHLVDRPFELYPLHTVVFDDKRKWLHIDRNKWIDDLNQGWKQPASAIPLLHKLPDKKLYLQPDSYTCLQACLATYLGIPFYYVLERIPSTPDKDKYPFDKIESLLEDFGLSWVQFKFPEGFCATELESGLYIAGCELLGGAEHATLVYCPTKDQKKLIEREGETVFTFEHCPLRANTSSEVFSGYKITHLYLFPKRVRWDSSTF